MGRKFCALALVAAALIGIGLTAGASVGAAHTRVVRCVVPRLTGDTVAKARTALTRAHCKAGKLTGPSTGIVTAQSLKPGRREKRGTPVALKLVKVVKKKAPTTTTTPKPTASTVTPQFSTGVDPSFVQDPSNPLHVTYSYSGSASETVDGKTEDLGSLGQLPSGVLDFYAAYSSGGPSELVCSMNVGGSVTGGTCSVTYTTTGTFGVTTQYLPTGATPVTSTDQETINPAATSTSVACNPATYDDTQMATCTATVTGPNGSSEPANGFIDWVLTDTTTGSSACSGIGSTETYQLREDRDVSPPTYQMTWVTDPASVDWNPPLSSPTVGYPSCESGPNAPQPAGSGPISVDGPSDSLTVQAYFGAPVGYSTSLSSTAPISVGVVPENTNCPTGTTTSTPMIEPGCGTN